jgi:NAD(P)-dependent dehydrogenase (short-subunit alcohol dehydrogenase family)
MSQSNKVARNALVTGSTSDIDLAIARARAAQGLKVSRSL